MPCTVPECQGWFLAVEFAHAVRFLMGQGLWDVREEECVDD